MSPLVTLCVILIVTKHSAMPNMVSCEAYLNRHIFSEWAKLFFLIFFPVENSHIGRPKTNFRRFQNKSEKRKKKKKKKKRSSPLFITFPILLFPISHLPFYNFPSFSFQFYPFSVFSRYVSKNFPVRSLWGGTLPPCPRLLRHWLLTTVYKIWQANEDINSTPSYYRLRQSVRHCPSP